MNKNIKNEYITWSEFTFKPGLFLLLREKPFEPFVFSSLINTINRSFKNDTKVSRDDVFVLMNYETNEIVFKNCKINLKNLDLLIENKCCLLFIGQLKNIHIFIDEAVFKTTLTGQYQYYGLKQ